MLRRLNPFRSLDNPKEVWAWGMYDLANQSFTLLIITLLFPIYFKKVIVGDDVRGDALWSIAGSGSLLIVVLLSPLVGAAADAYGIKKRLLVLSGVACAALTVMLAVIGAGMVAVAMAAFIAANIVYQLGENLLAGFLPEISNSRNIGRISATGWTMGYVGALVLQVLVVGGMLAFGLADTLNWWWFFILAGLWFAAGIVPPALILREVRAAEPRERQSLLRATFSRLAETMRRAREFRQLRVFLTSFFVYALGVQTVIYFAGIIANDFGLSDVKLMLFALQLSLTAGIAAVATGLYQDRIGAVTTVAVFLGVWILTAAGLLGLTLIPAGSRADNEWMFWVVGNGVGLGLGGIGTASRSVVGLFTPRHKTAEFFGLWGMTYKFAGVVGVLMFGQVKALVGNSASMVVLLAFFVAGLVLLTRVNGGAGVRAAKRAERVQARAYALDNDRRNPRTETE
ncbi:MAG: MFS transporter [Phycisphaeraceae bacterium]|nr:MFS transporter [Phycisphaeraceae bacterium]MCW5763934.1 MFS transporter [Phycisphaeraceae bacterium]